MVNTTHGNKALLPSYKRAALLATSFFLNATVMSLAPAAQAEPLADHVYGGCQLSAGSINGLLSDISLSSSNILSSPQVDYVVAYTRDNPNHGQQLTAGPSTYTGPVVCNNVSVPQDGWLTSLQSTNLNEALGTSADPLSITAMEQAQILQTVPAGAASLTNAENKFCHSAAGHVDCFRLTQVQPPVLTAPVAPSAGHVWGGCTLGAQAVQGVEGDMVAGGIPAGYAKVDYLVVYSRSNPNDGQFISGTDYSGPVLCVNPANVAAGQVQENTLIPPLVDLKGLNQSTYLQYAPSSGFGNTGKKICHTAAGNTDCFLVSALAPPPPPPAVFSASQDFDTAGLEYASSAWYGNGGYQLMQDVGGPNGNFMRLTPDETNHLNMIAFKRINTGTFSHLVVDFDFRIISNPYTLYRNPRADGIGFAFMNTGFVYDAFSQSTKPGTSFIGASPFPISEDADLTLTAIPLDSFQIGFDTYFNIENDLINGYPDNNHVSIIHNTSSPYPATNKTDFPVTGLIDLANGVFNHVQIDVVPAGSGLNVTLTITPDIFNGGNALPSISTTVPLSPYNGRMVFGGRTGANQESHDIDNIRITITE